MQRQTDEAMQFDDVSTLSIDLDNAWSYLKTRGSAGWEDFPSYFDIVVPRVLDLLDRHGLRITWFIVGQDAVLAKNRPALKSIAASGHEVGNHSFHHEPWMVFRSETELTDELLRAHQAIVDATGLQPRGYRAPGYGLSSAMLEAAAHCQYDYDASTLPTFIGPLARAYYFMTTKLPSEERAQRSALFGRVSDGFRPLRPYRWKLNERTLLELPVTTMPIFRTPFHVSYLIYLASFSIAAARRYFRMALALCRRRGVAPSLLLHPLDFLGGDDVQGFDFFPGMGLAAHEKVAFVDWCVGQLAGAFAVSPIGQFADTVAAARPELPVHTFTDAGPNKYADRNSRDRHD